MCDFIAALNLFLCIELIFDPLFLPDDQVNWVVSSGDNYDVIDKSITV